MLLGAEYVFQSEVSAADCVESHNGFLLLGLLPVVLVTGLASGSRIGGPLITNNVPNSWFR